MTGGPSVPLTPVDGAGFVPAVAAPFAGDGPPLASNDEAPWHDPAMDPNSEVGGKFIRDWLETQIIPAHGVVLLAGVYAVKSARRWLDLEVQFARKHNKPIIAIPALDQEQVSEEVRALCDRSVGWDAAAVIQALDQLQAQPATPPSR